VGKGHKVAANGRNLGETQRFVLLRRSLLHSPQFSVLAAGTRALILEMHAMFNGTNNGVLFLSVRDGASRLGFTDLKAATRYFNEALQVGWITETIGSEFRIKADSVSRARAFRLNWIDARSGRCVGPDALPPLDFGRLSEAQKRRVEMRQDTLKRYLKNFAELKSAVEGSSTLDARMAFVGHSTVEQSSTLKDGNGEKPPNSIDRESSTHIETMGLGVQPSRLIPSSNMLMGRFAAKPA
jgi:hypothetical protein